MANRRKTQKISPYLCVAAVLILIAVTLLVAILAIAFSEDPSTPPGAESSVAGQTSSGSEASANPSGAPQTSYPVSFPPENSDNEASEEPPATVVGSLAGQPASAVAYESKVGKAYAIDMNPYEQYVNPADPMEYVFLVDATHTLNADFVPDDLVLIKYMRAGRPDYYSHLRFCAEMALEAFIEEGKQCGIDDVTVSNGYRSYAIQKQLFDGYLAKERAKHPDYTEEQIEALVLEYSLRPGTSEHQSGLCVDMHNQIDTDLTFAGTEAALWLEANCYRFGFILRYPEDKEDITTVMFEPWHFRFVGRVAATEMHELGMCLEEYCAYKGIV